jgi:hypothetical protein
LKEPLEVLCKSIESNKKDIENYTKYIKNKNTNENKIYKNQINHNVSFAIPNEDFEPINQIIKFDKNIETKVKKNIHF